MGVIRHIASSIAAADHTEREKHRARMVPVAMRQHDALDHAEINREARHVSLERIVLRAGVEQHGAAFSAAMRGHKA